MQDLSSLFEYGKWFCFVVGKDDLTFRARAVKKNKLFPYNKPEQTDQYYMCAMEAKSPSGESLGNAFFDVYEGQRVYISSIFTKEEYRGLGIGSKMLGVIEFVATSFGAQYIDGRFHATTEHAKEFYEKNGFEILDEDEPSASIKKCIDKNKSFDDITFFEREQDISL